MIIEVVLDLFAGYCDTRRGVVPLRGIGGISGQRLPNGLTLAIDGLLVFSLSLPS